MTRALEDHSPIDGDPDAIQSCAAHYASAAEAIRATSENLAVVVAGAQARSEAVEAFEQSASEVRGHLGAVVDRYGGVAEQLAQFSTELRALQGQAEVVMAAARDAHGDEADARAHLGCLLDQIAALDPQDPAVTTHLVAVHELDQRVEHLQAIVAAKSGELRALVDQWRSAAQRCAHAIRDTVDESSVNDSAWDRALVVLEAVVHEVLPLIEIALDILAAVLTIAAVLVVLTGVGAALAPALFAVARLATVASKIVTAVKVALTTILVSAGRASPAALVAIGVDVAVGTVGGKLADAAVEATARRLSLGSFDQVTAALTADVTAAGDVSRAAPVVRLSRAPAIGRAEAVADTAVDVFPGFGIAKGLDEGLALMTAWYPRQHVLNGWSTTPVALTLDVAGLYGRTGAGSQVPTSVGTLLTGQSSAPTAR